MAALPAVDELAVVGAVRGEPVPVVKCVTNDVYVPADAEYVIEGFLDPAGYVEPEGPYGEYVGYYGVVKRNPVLHVTAITHREDALFQTLTIGGRTLAHTDTTQLSCMKTETAAWAALLASVREPLAVYATPSSGGMYNVRVALRQRLPGDARNAIAAVLGSHAEAKHVFVFDPDIDVFSDAETDWALATRFQADRDLIAGSGFRVVPLDPSLGGARTGAKLGFDCTIPFGKADAFAFSVPAPPSAKKTAAHRSVVDTLAAGPASFLELMAARGSKDGREIVRELDALYAAQRLGRHDDGRYVLNRTHSEADADCPVPRSAKADHPVGADK
jgi:3-polyprenyl-4-hydroxybenzoate decarboxylase